MDPEEQFEQQLVGDTEKTAKPSNAELSESEELSQIESLIEDVEKEAQSNSDDGEGEKEKQKQKDESQEEADKSPKEKAKGEKNDDGNEDSDNEEEMKESGTSLDELLGRFTETKEAADGKVKELRNQGYSLREACEMAYPNASEEEIQKYMEKHKDGSGSESGGSTGSNNSSSDSSSEEKSAGYTMKEAKAEAARRLLP